VLLLQYDCDEDDDPEYSCASPAQEAPAEARAAALLFARVHARLALSRLTAEGHGRAAQPQGRSASSFWAGGGGSELTSESCKVCWEAKCNTLYTPCGHVRIA